MVLLQIPTLWNLADIGTKPLGAKRLKLLLHEISVCTSEGQYVVGQLEFEQQSTKHGGGKELAALAKNIARVLIVMGLGRVPGDTLESEQNDQ